LKQGRLLFRLRATDIGSPHPYIAARCETGKLEAKGEFIFSDASRLEGTFFRPCKVRP
jgi:hypothetical protein